MGEGCQARKEKIQPKQGNIIASVYAAGTIKARNQYEVYSKINGIIKKVHVEENNIVSRGAPLFDIGNESTRLNTENAKLTAAFHSIYSNKEKIQELKSNILLAQAKYHIDSLNCKRQEYLFNRDIGSRNELEQRQLVLNSSRAALESAQHTYATVMKQLRIEEKLSNNDFLISKSNEKDYIISSEINGKVYSVNKQEGEMVNPTTPIAVIGDSSNFYVELEVDELDISKIKLNQEVVISLDSYPDTVFQGSISKIYPMMDQRTKTFTVEANFTIHPPILYPMLTVEASIITEEKMNALIIPRSYLISDSFVLCGDKKKRVTTGIKDYEKVEIISGLSAKDVIYKPGQ